MTPDYPESLWARASQLIESKLGLHFPQNRWVDLRRGLVGATQQLGLPSVEACLDRLVEGPLARPEVELLASHLTVGETYFFRERTVFEALEREILPKLLLARQSIRQLRIWSAGCCTGEEPYSIAMVLDRLLRDWSGWNVFILATDINPSFLKRAQDGVYKRWSFRDVPATVQSEFFDPVTPQEQQLRLRIRERVTFAYLNLAEDTFPSLLNRTNAMDLILCRNVLMYFSPGSMGKVVDRFYRSLVEGGWLVVSPTESANQLFRPFQSVMLGGNTFYQKAAPSSHSALPAFPTASSRPSAASPPRRASAEARHLQDPPPSNRRVQPRSKEDSIRVAPSRSGARDEHERAAQLYEEGRYAEAETLLGAAMNQRLPSVAAITLRARLAANQGRLPEALGWCDRAIARDALDPAPYQLRAAVLQELGRLGEAMVCLQKSLYLDPESALSHFALGHLELRLERPAAASKAWVNALSILQKLPSDTVLAGSEGLTAGRLAEIIRSNQASQRLN